MQEDEGLLAEVPVAGLRSKGGNRGGTKRKGKESSSKSVSLLPIIHSSPTHSSNHSTPMHSITHPHSPTHPSTLPHPLIHTHPPIHRSSSTNQPPRRQTRSTTRKRAGQPTIAESLAGPQTKQPKSTVDQYTEDLPASAIDELFDFEFQPSGGVAPAISVEATRPELEGGKEKHTSDGRTTDHSEDLFGASETEAEDRVIEKMDNSDLVDAAIFDIRTPPLSALVSSQPPRTLSDMTNTPTSSPIKPQQKDLPHSQTLIPHPHVDGGDYGNNTPLQQALICGNQCLPPLSSSEAMPCSIGTTFSLVTNLTGREGSVWVGGCYCKQIQG